VIPAGIHYQEGWVADWGQELHHGGVWWSFSTYGALFGSLRLCVFLGRAVARFFFIAYLDSICIAVVLFQLRAEVGVLSFAIH
jgi:hypothetical protein